MADDVAGYPGVGDRFTRDGPDGLLLRDGATALGRVPDGLAVPTGPIELARGWQDERIRNGRGLVHIEFRHGDEIRAAGWACVTDFVVDLARRFNEIRQDQGGQLFLVRRNPALTRSQDPHSLLIVRPAPAGAAGWQIETAGRFKSAYIAKRSLLWQAVHTAAPQPNELAAPSNAPPTQMSVSVGRLSARDQSWSRR